MERRGFLKACAALIAAPLIDVPAVRLIVPSQAMIPGETWFSTVRELCAYDLGTDGFIMRYDMLFMSADGMDNQLGIDMRATEDDLLRGGLQRNRDIAAEMFGNELRHRGIRLADLKPLPLPPGYVEPNVMQWARRNAER